MPEPRVAIIVPWRAGDPHRERAWTWVRQWWEQFGWPIFEVEHPAPEPFNRAWCINEGARRAWPWDVLVITDADVFEADPEQIRAGVRSCFETGRFTVPHTVGSDLSAQGTQLLIQGAAGWEKHTDKVRPVCTSRVTIVREDLFSQVGGFDERFRGWGHEDVAFFHSTRTIRGADHLPGTSWHLWHVPSIRAAKPTREYRTGKQLAERYLSADRQGWPQIEPILRERTDEERWDRPEGDVPPAPRVRAMPAADRSVDVMCLTAGRRVYLEQTLASFAEHVRGSIAHRMILDDSGDAEFARWLKETYPEWDIRSTRGRSGFTKAIRAAWAHEKLRGGAPYIFHLEEDFTFDRDVDLSADLVPILEANEKLAQVALLRAAFFPPEIAAGGIIAEDPGAYEQQTDGERTWLVHRKFFTTNPCVYRRSLLRYPWPAMKNSETVFSRQLTRRGMRFAFYGDGEPMVTHIGVERTGLGY